MFALLGRAIDRAVYLVSTGSAALAVVVATVRPDGTLGGML